LFHGTTLRDIPAMQTYRTKEKFYAIPAFVRP